MSLSRRQALALLAAGPALAALGAGGVLATVWDQAPGPGYRHLSPSEASFVRALGGAAWPATEACPLDGALAELDLFLDASLDSLPELPRKAARAGLHALDALTLPAAGARFRTLDLAQRSTWLTAWLNSDTMALRSAVTSIVLVLGMGYTTHPAAAPAFSRLYRCGYGR